MFRPNFKVKELGKMGKPNVLILVRRFDKLFPKHKVKYEFLQAIERVANVSYHHAVGEILEIVKRQKRRQDFIFHNNITEKNFLSHKLKNIYKININNGANIINDHRKNDQRRKYFKDNNISLIFSVSKTPFLKRFPEYKSKFRFLPFSINPTIITNRSLKKDIDFLLMGHIAK